MPSSAGIILPESGANLPDRRRLLLVSFDPRRAKDPPMSLARGSLAALLERRSVAEVVPVDVNLHDRPNLTAVVDRLLSLTQGHAPDQVDIAIGVFVWNERLVRRVVSGLRQEGFRGRIILGGPQISYSEGGLEVAFPGADLFLRGYAENVLEQVVAHPGAAPVGVHVAGTEDRGAPADVDVRTLVSPWLGGQIPLRLGDRPLQDLHWETKRGCPYECGYCQHRGALANRCVLELPFERVRDEIALFTAAKIRRLSVIDPVFNVGHDCLRILEELRRQCFGGQISIQCRGELINTAFLDALVGLDVLPEVGVQTVHEAECRAVNRTNRLSLVERAFDGLRVRGISYMATLIYGLPEQTLTSFLESVRWCLDRRVPIIRAFPLMLLPGTAVHAQRNRWALVTTVCEIPAEDPEQWEFLEDEGLPLVVESSTFSQSDYQEMAKIANALHRTEGQHPARLEELRAMASQIVPHYSLGG